MRPESLLRGGRQQLPAPLFFGLPNMPTRVCVFVDGENFRHSIVDIFRGEFPSAEYLPQSADWTGFFDHIVEQSRGNDEAKRLRTYWYVTQYVDFIPFNLPNPESRPEDFLAIVRRNKNTAREIDSANPDDRPEKLNQIYRRLQARELTMQRRFQHWMNIQNAITANHTAIEFRRAGVISYNLYDERFGQEKCVDVKLAVDLLILRDA